MAYSRTWECRIANLCLAICLVLFLLPAQFLHAQQRIFLYFPWNDSQWTDSYFGNGSTLDSISRYIGQIGQENIEALDVTAYASPEGSYLNNQRLCRERAARFDTILGNRFPDIPATVTTGGEAWELLRKRVSADPKIRPELRERILRILDDDTISNDTRKWRLANKLENSDYRYLLYAHYRYLRCYEVVISIKAPEPRPEPIRELETKPEHTTQPQAEPVQETPVLEPVITEPAPQPAPVVKKPVLAISTNLPYDITYFPKYGFTSIPSFSLEYYPSNYGHWTFGADLEIPWATSTAPDTDWAGMPRAGKEKALAYRSVWGISSPYTSGFSWMQALQWGTSIPATTPTNTDLTPPSGIITTTLVSRKNSCAGTTPLTGSVPQGCGFPSA